MVSIRGLPCVEHGVLQNVIADKIVFVPCACARPMKQVKKMMTLGHAAFHGVSEEVAAAALDGKRAQWICMACCTQINNATRGCADPMTAVQGHVGDMLAANAKRRQERKERDAAGSPGMSTDVEDARRMGMLIGKDAVSFFRGTRRKAPPQPVEAVRTQSELHEYVKSFPALLIAFVDGFLEATVGARATAAAKKVWKPRSMHRYGPSLQEKGSQYDASSTARRGSAPIPATAPASGR